MNHPPYDRWLFADDLAENERASLAEHLNACDSCRTRSMAWQDVEAALRSAGAAAPEAGFVARWKVRQMAAQENVSRWQGVSAMSLVFGSTAALVALRLLASPPSLADLAVWVSKALDVFGLLRTLQSVAWNLMDVPRVPWFTALPVAGLAGTALVSAAGLLAVWMLVVYRLAWRAAPVRSRAR
jgi:anti-sigma factor RsiW